MKNCSCNHNRSYGTQENDRIIRQDEEERRKEEKKRGKRLSDIEWFQHKIKGVKLPCTTT